MNTFDNKIVETQHLATRLNNLPRPWVFTNGCFDLLHRGHVCYLDDAKQLGASLIVGINSDQSVQLLGKGGNRPINTLDDRMAVIAALASVDLLIAFDQQTPLTLIKKIKPDHLVKGGDWPVDSIVGAEFVQSNGGEVDSLAFEFDRSSSALIEKIRSQ